MGLAGDCKHVTRSTNVAVVRNAIREHIKVPKVGAFRCSAHTLEAEA